MIAVQQDTPTRIFTEPYLGLQFSYPKTWTIEKTTLSMDETVTKGKVKKDNTRTLFSIPVQNSSNKGELQVVRTEYHASIDLWQTIQVRENELEKRTLVRQWDQDIMGVPMLFSRTDYTEHGTAMSSILGLFYTRTSYKLLLRLTAPTADFDKVAYEFNSMLETLRTVDGKLPKEDDPSIDLEPVTKKTPQAPLPPHSLEPVNKHPKSLAKAPVAIETVVSTKKVILRVPEGWSAVGAKENMLELKSDGLNVPLHIQLYSTLDSDLPDVALIKLSANDLPLFSKVSSREDTSQKANSAGTSISTVWRVGQADSGYLVTGEASAAMGQYYLLLTYKQTSGIAYKTERKLIEALLSQVSIEPAP